MGLLLTRSYSCCFLVSRGESCLIWNCRSNLAKGWFNSSSSVLRLVSINFRFFHVREIIFNNLFLHGLFSQQTLATLSLAALHCFLCQLCDMLRLLGELFPRMGHELFGLISSCYSHSKRLTFLLLLLIDIEHLELFPVELINQIVVFQSPIT